MKNMYFPKHTLLPYQCLCKSYLLLEIVPLLIFYSLGSLHFPSTPPQPHSLKFGLSALPPVSIISCPYCWDDLHTGLPQVKRARQRKGIPRN
jgi:hypothetical protein